MIQEIRYKGFTEAPSDYECPDGDLAALVNIVPEDETLKPILSPATLFTLPDGYDVVFMHQNTGYRHYIIRNDKKIYWIDEPEQGATITAEDFIDSGDNRNLLYTFGTAQDYTVNAIGNTVVVFASEEKHYILWKGETSKYKYLGTHIPELPISFGLQGEMIRGDEFTIQFDNINFASGDFFKEFTDDNKITITQQVLANVNKFIAENSTNAGKFIYPFLVRYAYRLYDLSLTKHSAPVLMVCSSDLAPQCFVTLLQGQDSQVNQATLRLASVLHQLDYAVSSADKDSLSNWGDIVKSVEIFISKPIYTYNQNGECTSFVKTEYSDCYCVCKHTNQHKDIDQSEQTGYPIRYQINSFSKLYAFTFNPTTLASPPWRLMLPTRDNEAIKADISDNANFYLLKSINIGDLQTSRTIIPVSNDYLKTLVNREVMTDDYDSHDYILPKYAFPYNSRLNIANIKKNLFGGFNAKALFPFTNGNVQKYSGGESPTIGDYKQTIKVKICIRQGGKEIVVEGGSADFGAKTPFLFIYYPNPYAYKAIISVSNNTYTPVYHYYEVPMEPHPTLNGAYYIGIWEGAKKSENEISNVPSNSVWEERFIDLPNKIYTSEVDNPFYFPVTGIKTVGTGTILALSTAAKALSQGQFGKFPLYAFTSEGVWSFEVKSDGTFMPAQIITRDVVLGTGDSVTQLDSSVLFATDRGIMLLSGSNSICITDTINTSTPFSPSTLPGINRVLSDSIAETLHFIPFKDFIQSCRILYDYTHQRIIVFNPGQHYAYVYSLKSKQWGMMHSHIKDSINSFPSCLASVQVVTTDDSGQEPTQITTNNIVNFSLSADEATPQATPSESQATPSESQATPAESQATPAESQATPSESQATPSESQATPSESQATVNAASAAALLITRPLKLGQHDVLKTIDTIIQRGYFRKGHVKTILYGSRDLFNWHLVFSSTDHILRGFLGTPYKYFRVALICNLEKDESIFSCTIRYTPRHVNQPR